MAFLANLVRHGVPAVVGFVLGLVALAVIRPETTNGKILLVLTVICIAIAVGALIALVRRMRTGEPGEE